MIGVLRVVAPVVGACLFAMPALAQTSAVPDGQVSPAEQIWHVRAALNVAALACRGADGDETAQLYNAMLAREKDPLASANAGTEAAYKARFAGHWQDAEDSAMTRLYNDYAAQPDRDAFCAAAHDVLRDARAVEPAQFADFALAALPRLEARFAVAAPVRMEERPVIAALSPSLRPAVSVEDMAEVPVAPAPPEPYEGPPN